MATLLLSEFRAISKLSASQVPDDLAKRKIRAASALACRLANKDFGMAIERLEQASSDAKLTIYGHQLPASGKVFLTGVGVSGLSGAVTYTRVDADSILVAGVTVGSIITNRGFAGRQYTKDFQDVDQSITLRPSPVLAVEEIRLLNNAWPTEGVFDSGDVVASTDYYLPKNGRDNWQGQVVFSGNVWTKRAVRLPGRINRVVRNQVKPLRVTYYAGCDTNIPDDLLEAICAIAVQMTKDPTGDMQSENYDYYSYSKMSAAELRAMPGSAINTILAYNY